MSFTHELSDVLCRIRVAQATKDIAVEIRQTSLTLELTALFLRNGLIQSFFIPSQRRVIWQLKYSHNRPLLGNLRIISSPGHRVYWSLRRLALATNRHAPNHVFIVSTPRGLCTNYECLVAPQRYQGGEVLFAIRLNS